MYLNFLVIIIKIDPTLFIYKCKGGWWMKGVLSDQSLEEFNKFLVEMVTSHFVVYKTFAKKLAEQPNSTYTFISGSSCEEMYDRLQIINNFSS